MNTDIIRERLFSMGDEKYLDFQSALVPTVDKNKIIGVRIPQLRAYAKELKKSYDSETICAFLAELPHKYYEENNLHALLLEMINDYDECVAATDKFLPYVDNWATCDMMRPKILGKYPEKLHRQCKIWLSGDDVYAVRFAIGCYMNFFLDDNFSTDTVDEIVDVCQNRCGEYYIHMMIAWYFATALFKQYDAVLPYIEQHRLCEKTHNKAISKACESRRISDEQKKYLRSLKIHVK